MNGTILTIESGSGSESITLCYDQGLFAQIGGLTPHGALCCGVPIAGGSSVDPLRIDVEHNVKRRGH